MVKVQYAGTLPAKLRLGVCGLFKFRSFLQDPVRSYICQTFGHVATTCTTQKARCRLCAGPHFTEACQEKKNTGEAITIECANCGEEHLSISGLCPTLRNLTTQARAKSLQIFTTRCHCMGHKTSHCSPTTMKCQRYSQDSGQQEPAIPHKSMKC